MDLAKEAVYLIISVIILIIIWTVWNSVFSLLPEYFSSDTQSYESYQRVISDVNNLVLGKSSKTIYTLESSYSLLLLNPGSATEKIKERYKSCNLGSCVCLCQDSNCDKVDCTEVKKIFKNYDRITGSGELILKYDKDGVYVDQNNNK